MENITICIPAYNEQETIQKCIESIQKQKNVSINEILVGTNGSTDLTGNIVNQLRKKDNRIKIIDSPKGKPNAWNYMNKVAKNNIRVFVDGDCFLECNAIANLIKDIDVYTMLGGTLNFITNNVGYMSKIIHYPKRLYPQYFDLCGALYAINFNKLILSMNKYGYKEMPIDLIADDRWLVLVSKDVNIVRNAIVYTNACSINDQIKRVKRMLISDEQLMNKFNNVYLNLENFNKNESKFKLKKEELSTMSLKEKIVYSLILPLKKIISKYIFIVAKHNMKKEKVFLWEKIETSRSR